MAEIEKKDIAFKAGFAVVLGRPNVGKSTFLNRVVGQKVAIVSDKPQTTRRVIKGIVNREDAQIVFLDTPGLHQPIDSLGKFMMEEVRQGLEGVDLILYMTVPGTDWEKEEPYLKSALSLSHSPVFLVVNQIDRFEKEVVEQTLKKLRVFPFQFEFAISALTGEGIPQLLDKMVEILPESPAYFPGEIASDLYQREVVAEIIREKVWNFVYQEVPYGVEVRVEEFKDRGSVLYLRATIFVEKDSQKKIVIGAGGQMIKKIGKAAREEIELNWGKKTFLDLWVKVEKNWRKRPEVLRRWGYCH
ncbi:MAG: GTPase [Candidatus Atribacteria bacterium]|nr:GTPase [Candidatus Atribacteria bacterium]